jgi:hypothetical protein
MCELRYKIPEIDKKAEIEDSCGQLALPVARLNFLHRTRILNRLEADHPYGPVCYRPGGCVMIQEGAFSVGWIL